MVSELKTGDGVEVPDSSKVWFLVLVRCFVGGLWDVFVMADVLCRAVFLGRAVSSSLLRPPAEMVFVRRFRKDSNA